MPILDIEIVVDDGETPDPGLALALADATAAVFGLPAGKVWVKLRELHSTHYAENGVAGSATPRPVFVQVLKSAQPEGEALEHEAAALASAVAKACGRPRENVHILYEPSAAGRIAFGGKLIRK